MSDRDARLSADARENALIKGFARIRGVLEHPVRGEDPECCLFMISEIVTEMIGNVMAGIPPQDEEDG